MNKSGLEEALKEATEMEEKGYNFYKNISEKSENNLTKKTFDYLAANEMFHIENIKEFYDTLVNKGEFPEIELKKEAEKRSNDLTVFSKDIFEFSEKIKPNDDDNKACEFALQFERDGYGYYKSMLNVAENENLKKLLSFLIDEEKKHYELIMRMHEYISDSQNWYMYDEGSFPQG